MRMWMCDTEILCQKHLCGMHLEMHMFIGHMKKRRKIDGFLQNNCLQPLLLKKKHDDIAKEMKKRGYDHKTPLLENDFINAMEYLDEKQINYKINNIDSLNELISRCKFCEDRYNAM